ncbi:C2H2-type domain-containing protein [Caenorhabditis elegans]|uniref:C2H2-type domain-containing protein n=1 Tax=Caenorhabditis elegans TaxID=6239 RepID=Q8T7Z2_CAEEL|nr:C2H2-type domain-containing protein [Caenorhabditis elegans]CCD64406.1 C2H2-type domain-containing protein [Caenorhabditis elegans]|eukprot:NP_741535.1 Uncharacterized protein CELE_K11D12.12 [Caenorhabditis elegans]
MDLLPGFREEILRKFIGEGGKIVTTKHLERFQLLITAISRDGKLIRGVLDQKSRFNRELMNREKYETPYIVELPGDHPADTEHVRYSVSLPRTKRVIALRYEKETPSTSSETKTKRIRTAAQLLGDTEDYCCRTCFKRFSRKFNLERHEDGCLPKPILFQCPICHQKYKRAPYFAAHIRQHEAEEKRQHRDVKRLAIEHGNMDEIRRKAEESVNKLSIPYEFGTFL